MEQQIGKTGSFHAKSIPRRTRHVDAGSGPGKKTLASIKAQMQHRNLVWRTHLWLITVGELLEEMARNIGPGSACSLG